jgi:serine protease AprX
MLALGGAGPSYAGDRAGEPAVGAPGSTALSARQKEPKLSGELANVAEQSRGGLIRIVATLRSAPSKRLLSSIQHRVGDVAGIRRLASVNAFAAAVTKRQLAGLTALAEVAHVELDSVVTGLNDTAQSSFGVTKAKLDIPNIDGDGDGVPGVYSAGDLVAAVIDSGIDAGHRDLDEGKVLAFVNCLSGACVPASPFDDNGHGTHVAATIAGDGDGRDDHRYRGVAPGAALVGVKVLRSDNKGLMSDVINGIAWVVEHRVVYGIEAINLSLGSAGCWDGTEAAAQAVNGARAAGLVVVVAAGNDGPNECTVTSPGSAADALTVGAMSDMGVVPGVDRSARPGFLPAWFSSRGPTADGRIKPDILAPGVRVTSAQANSVDGYADGFGTSMAAPFASGVAVLMLDANPALTPDQVKETIMSTAVPWGNGVAGPIGPNADYGAGRLDAYAALARAGASLTAPPAMPAHLDRAAALAGPGASIDFPLRVVGTEFPLTATLLSSGWQGADPTFTLSLRDPSGSEVASSAFSTRQEEVSIQPATVGLYMLRVSSVTGGGSFVLDVSGPLAPPPSLVINDVNVREGDVEGTVASFAVSLSAPSADFTRVAFSTHDGSADTRDYQETAGTVTLAPGETQGTIRIPITGDVLEEPAEAFAVRLAAPMNATLGDGEALGSIVDDDALPLASTRAAEAIGPTSAVLRGVVDPRGKAAVLYADVGPTVAYGTTTPIQQLGPTEGSHDVSIVLSGLRPATRYNARLVVRTPVGTTHGANVAFRTAARRVIVAPQVRVLKRSFGVGRDGLVSMPLACRNAFCRGTVLLRAKLGSRHEARVGGASFAIRPGARRNIQVRLSAGARATIKRRGRLYAQAVVRTKLNNGSRRTVVGLKFVRAPATRPRTS